MGTLLSVPTNHQLFLRPGGLRLMPASTHKPAKEFSMKLRILLIACAACFTLHPASTSKAASNRPNVLLILVDDLKPSFGAYGDKWVHSPNLDRLAARGMRFDMAYCNQAVCAPSRNNLLLGSRSTSIGVYSLGQHFRTAVPAAVTMPQYFKNHGYHSAGIGKVFHIGHGNINDVHSWSVPFHPDKVIDYVLPESTGGKLTREEALFSNRSKVGLPMGTAWENADVLDGAYADGRIAAEGIKRLQTYRKSDQPFFLALGFTKPHLPFCAPKKYWDLYDRSKLPTAEYTLPPEGAPPYAGKTIGELNQYKPVPPNPPLSEELQRTLIHGYYASLSYMDSQVGRVLDEVDNLGLDKNTIIVLWGDHGYHLGDHGTWTKHTNYEQANRIPITISAPGITTADSQSKALIETVDLFPTIAALAGLPAPTGPQPIDGDSFVPVLRGEDTNIGQYAYHCYPKGGRLGRAIRTDRYRLVEWSQSGNTQAPEYELYDYETDPLEKRNHSADRPRIVKKLTTILAQHPAPKSSKRPKRRSTSKSTAQQKVVQNPPKIANRLLTIMVEGQAELPHGVVLAQGGREHGFAIHFAQGRPAFDVRVNGEVTRLTGKPITKGRFQLTATLTADEMTFAVRNGPTTRIKSPGLIPVQPKDALSIGFDDASAAGNYDSPNPFNGTVLSTRISTLTGQTLYSSDSTR
jgi:iduronate 2-sulfatase